MRSGRTPLPLLLLALPVVAATLVACAGDSDTTPTSSTVTATTTAATPSSIADVPSDQPVLVVGEGYEYTTPAGWGQYDELPEGADTVANSLTDDDGFIDNVNVLLSPVGLITIGMAERYGSEELTSAGAQDVTVADRLTVAGGEAAHITAVLSVAGKRFVVEQIYLNDADRTYVITFSFSATAPESERQAVKDAVLSSWTWL